MEKVPTVAVDNFLSDWNSLFPDMPLKMGDLKRPQQVMMALFHLFDRLGVTKDALLPSPEEGNEHLPYFFDLMPLMNSVRIVNRVSMMPQDNLSISIMDLLQPTATRSYTILVLLFNQTVFNESKLEDIAPFEEELFAYKDRVKSLTEKKNSLIQMRNMEAVEKGNRAEHLEQLDREYPILEEEVKELKKIEAELLQESEAVTKENEQTHILLEQKKANRDGILAENSRKKALKVSDAEDIRGQAEQAAQNVRSAQEKLGALSATLAQKEGLLHNLQALKPALDQANSLLHDLGRLADTMKDFESGDLESDGAEGELGVLESERAELEGALGEASAAAAAAATRRRQRRAARARAAHEAENALRESEEQHKRSREEVERATNAIRSLKEDTTRRAQERAAGQAEITAAEQRITRALVAMQDNLLNKLKDVGKKVEEQNKRRRKL